MIFQLTVAATVVCSSFSAERPVGPVPSHAKVALNLAGKWQSFEFGGRNIGTGLKSLTFIFTSDGRYTASVVMDDGQKETHKGRYVVLDTVHFEIKISGKTRKAYYSIQDGVLTIHDPEVGSYAKFKKIP
jgi:hypothetical protein